MTFEGFPVQRCENRSPRSESESSFTELWFVCLGTITNIPFLLGRHFWIDDFSGLFFFEVGYGEFPEKRWYWISLLGILFSMLTAISWILWTGSQVCGIMKCHRMNLKITNCDFSKRNALMTVERQTLIFANQNNGSIDVLLNWMRGAQIYHVNDMHVRCALFWLPQGVDTWQPTLLNMTGLKNSYWKWPRKYNRCFASQTFIPSLFDGMVYNFWGMFLWYLAVIDHEFLTRLLFFPKFSTQQWVKEEIGSWKKLHEDHHYHYIINGVYTLILFNFYVHFCKLLQHTQQNIYSIYYYTYTYTYVHLIIYPYGFQY